MVSSSVQVPNVKTFGHLQPSLGVFGVSHFDVQYVGTLLAGGLEVQGTRGSIEDVAFADGLVDVFLIRRTFQA